MVPEPRDSVPDENETTGPRRTVVLLTLAAVVAAALVGFIGGAFRWCLERAVELRADVVDWAHQWPTIGWLVPVAMVAAGAALGRAVVRLSPRSSGSGIQDVEAVWRGEKELPDLGVVPAKFAGGLASIGSGMVLGREGPTVHMGSTLGSEIGRLFGLTVAQRTLLYTTVGGAGLAVAFNAPVGGAMFAIEEVTKSVKLRIVLVTLISTSVAVACARVVVGDRPDFAVPAIATPSLTSLWVFVVFGLLTGALGVAYNAVVVGMLRRTDRMRRVGPVARATVIGGILGALLYVDPLLVGGGDALTQLIMDGRTFAIGTLLGYLALRFIVGPLSYAAGTPGGLFAPLLALGALWGAVFQAVAGPLLGEAGTSALPLAVVGMAAFFAATVRAPITGIILIIEMTAITSLTVPMLAACAAAVLAATLLKGAPVYDSLRLRMLATRTDTPPPSPGHDAGPATT